LSRASERVYVARTELPLLKRFSTRIAPAWYESDPTYSSVPTLSVPPSAPLAAPASYCG
jgi:hypothetical protein